MFGHVVADHLSCEHYVLHLVVSLGEGHDATTAGVVALGDGHLHITIDVLDECPPPGVCTSNHRTGMLIDALQSTCHMQVTHGTCHVLEQTAVISSILPGDAYHVSLSVEDSSVRFVRHTNHRSVFAQVDVGSQNRVRRTFAIVD